LTESSRQREDDWFRENERKLLEEVRRAREERLKAAHYMKCPKCGHDLKPEQLQGIEIDRCTFCEGFFVDAGELEQMFLTMEQSKRQGFLRSLLRI
jgi:uncharacterized protein